MKPQHRKIPSLFVSMSYMADGLSISNKRTYGQPFISNSDGTSLEIFRETEHFMEKQEIIERLNGDVSNESYQRGINQLQQKGCRFSNMWEVINTFESLDQLRNKILYHVDHKKIDRSLKIAAKLLKARSKKSNAISEMRFADAKKHFKTEYNIKVELLRFIRNGSLKRHELISDYVVDILEPTLIPIEKLP